MKKYFFFLLLFSFIACKNTSTSQEKTVQKPELDIVKKHQLNTQLTSLSKEKIKTWKEYQSVDVDLKKYSNISANEALNNAVNLSKIVKQLKDSIRPSELINNSFRTRVNVFENEVLRLKDMTFIRNALSVDDINKQVDKIFEAFSATNSKINTVYAQLEVEKEIETTN